MSETSTTPSTPEHDTATVPSGRIARLAKLGTLATGVAGGMLAEGARQWAQGKRPSVSDLLLTPANARRLAEQLSRLRGAAMKVGQLLSMDAGDLLPPEFSEILAQLRSDAKSMPLSQLNTVLEANWGKGWNTRFSQFSFQPIAAASIGQVHSAHTQDGRHLALKIQYPGIRASIDSDVENVATLLRLSGILPKSLDIRPLLDEAKHQLNQEADYEQEAGFLRRYHTLLADNPDYCLPEVHDDFTTHQILAMTHVGGIPVEQLTGRPQEERDRIMTLLLSLVFREMFEFRLVQTDPNFSNYRYEPDSKRLILLDFGATRAYPVEISLAYRDLMLGAIHHHRERMDQAASRIGFFQTQIRPEPRAAVLDLFQQACEPLTWRGAYDFGASSLAARLRDAGMALSLDQGYWHTPPADALFLHRKLGGLYLLAAKLRARVDVQTLFARYSKEIKPDPLK